MPLVLIIIILAISFIIWQFLVIKKYYFNFDNIKIDIKKSQIFIKDKRISFKDVSYISIEEDEEQPSIAEKALSKGAVGVYLAKLYFHIKDESILVCKFNSKAALYNTLKTLQPYIRIDDDIDDYKPVGAYLYLIILIVAIIIAVLAK